MALAIVKCGGVAEVAMVKCNGGIGYCQMQWYTMINQGASLPQSSLVHVPLLVGVLSVGFQRGALRAPFVCESSSHAAWKQTQRRCCFLGVVVGIGAGVIVVVVVVAGVVVAIALVGGGVGVVAAVGYV